jgi:hypothetical protein
MLASVAQSLQESVYLFGCRLSCDAVALLDAADELILPPANYLHVVIGELAPLFANFTLYLFPFTFQLIGIRGVASPRFRVNRTVKLGARQTPQARNLRSPIWRALSM